MCTAFHITDPIESRHESKKWCDIEYVWMVVVIYKAFQYQSLWPLLCIKFDYSKTRKWDRYPFLITLKLNTEECIYLKDKREIVCNPSWVLLMPLFTWPPLCSWYYREVQDEPGRKVKGLTKATEGVYVSGPRIEGKGVWLLWSRPVSSHIS